MAQHTPETGEEKRSREQRRKQRERERLSKFKHTQHGGRGAYHGVIPGGRVPGVVGAGAPAEEVPGNELRRPPAVGSPSHEP
jgi:hypothetical protein